MRRICEHMSGWHVLLWKHIKQRNNKLQDRPIRPNDSTGSYQAAVAQQNCHWSSMLQSFFDFSEQLFASETISEHLERDMIINAWNTANQLSIITLFRSSCNSGSSSGAAEKLWTADFQLAWHSPTGCLHLFQGRSLPMLCLSIFHLREISWV